MKKVSLVIVVFLAALLSGGVYAQMNSSSSGWGTTSTGVRYSMDPAVIQSVEQKAAAIHARGGDGRYMEHSFYKTNEEDTSVKRMHGKRKHKCVNHKCVGKKCTNQNHRACHSSKAAKKTIN